MFTGIIEEIGVVQSIKNGSKSSALTIKASKVLEKTKLGDSICTNGVCLTVTNIGDSTFQADVMAETLKRSNLGKLVIGGKVNLERALMLSDRLGGHIVSGHIDNTGEIISFINEDNAIWVTIKADKKIMKYVIEKGSIAIDGISLTVAYVIDSEIFKVSVIPHTKSETTLVSKKIGDTVNLECDVIGKYIEKFLTFSNSNESKLEKTSTITEDFLIKNGFL